jgi:hypothetical protein
MGHGFRFLPPPFLYYPPNWGERYGAKYENGDAYLLSYTVSVEKLWTQNTHIIHDVWRLLILSKMRSEYFSHNVLAGNINRWKNITADGLFRKNGTTTIWIWKHWNNLMVNNCSVSVLKTVWYDSAIWRQGKKCKKHGGFPTEVSDMAQNMKMELKKSRRE